MNNKNAVIILDGIFPNEKLFRNIVKSHPFIICADGSSNKLIKTKITPDIIIGDLDSIDKNVMLKYIKKGVPVMKLFDQETTDFEKCILFCRERNFNNLIILGAISDRTDHSLNNFSIIKRYYHEFDITIFDNYFKIKFLTDSISFNYKIGETVSLLPFPVARNITTEGLMYSLKNETLTLGLREGTLNVATKNMISIKYRSGDLILFIKHFL